MMFNVYLEFLRPPAMTLLFVCLCVVVVCLYVWCHALFWPSLPLLGIHPGQCLCRLNTFDSKPAHTLLFVFVVHCCLFVWHQSTNIHCFYPCVFWRCKKFHNFCCNVVVVNTAWWIETVLFIHSQSVQLFCPWITFYWRGLHCMSNWTVFLHVGCLFFLHAGAMTLFFCMWYKIHIKCRKNWL